MSIDRTTTTTTTITPQPPLNYCSVVPAWLDWPPLALLIIFGLSQINIITTIAQRQRVDVVPRVLMQISQTVLHSPITFHSLSLLWSDLCPLSIIDSTRMSHSFDMGAMSPILTRVCTLACTVPHTHNHSHSHTHYNQSNHSHFTQTSPMPRHQGNLHIILALKPARIFLFYSTSWYCVCHVTDHTRSPACTHFLIIPKLTFTHLSPHAHVWCLCSMSLTLFVMFVLRLVRSLDVAASISRFNVTCLKDWGTWLGLFRWCWMVLILWSPFISSYFCFFLFPSLHIVEAVMPPVALFRLQSASSANVLLLTVLIFWSVEACHWHCPESLVAKAYTKI